MYARKEFRMHDFDTIHTNESDGLLQPIISCEGRFEASTSAHAGKFSSDDGPAP
jgi:hypothetical protein